MVQLLFLEKGTQSARSLPHTTLMMMHSPPFWNTRIDILSIPVDWLTIQLMLQTPDTRFNQDNKQDNNHSITKWNNVPTQTRLLIWKDGGHNPLVDLLLLATLYTSQTLDGQSNDRDNTSTALLSFVGGPMISLQQHCSGNKFTGEKTLFTSTFCFAFAFAFDVTLDCEHILLTTLHRLNWLCSHSLTLVLIGAVFFVLLFSFVHSFTIECSYIQTILYGTYIYRNHPVHAHAYIWNILYANPISIQPSHSIAYDRTCNLVCVCISYASLRFDTWFSYA